MSASAIIADVRSLLQGESVFLAGSLCAEEAYGKANAHTDVDLFVPNGNVLISVGQKLLCAGFTFAPRMDRVWARWLAYGFKSWHTNSLKLHDPRGTEFNLVYKLTEGHAATSLAEVIESFDFGLLGMGYDLRLDQYRDMRSYLFPDHDPAGPLPMMPNKEMNWRHGFISQYNGLREMGRYAKYLNYGYDMSLVKDVLVSGYWSASSYLATTFDDEKKKLGVIYETIAQHIELDHVDELLVAAKQIEYKDALDAIMEALE